MCRQSLRVGRVRSVFSAATAKPDAERFTPGAKAVPSNVRSTMSVAPPPKFQTIMKSPAARLDQGLQDAIRALSSAVSGSTWSMSAKSQAGSGAANWNS